jgi:hypothetical protein
MVLLVIVLLIVAAVLFAIAAFGVGSRINLVAAGLFFVAVALLIPPLTAAVH